MFLLKPRKIKHKVNHNQIIQHFCQRKPVFNNKKHFLYFGPI